MNLYVNYFCSREYIALDIWHRLIDVVLGTRAVFYQLGNCTFCWHKNEGLWLGAINVSVCYTKLTQNPSLTVAPCWWFHDLIKTDQKGQHAKDNFKLILENIQWALIKLKGSKSTQIIVFIFNSLLENTCINMIIL